MFSSLFDRVQEKLAKNKNAPIRHKTEDDYPLTTELFRDYCGTYLCGERGISRTGNNHCYPDHLSGRCILISAGPRFFRWKDTESVRRGKAANGTSGHERRKYLLDFGAGGSRTIPMDKRRLRRTYILPAENGTRLSIA